jgi:alkylated DNA nucleotide flippase Atl1
MAYGAIALYLAEASGRASPRLVGHVLARDGDGIPWHRVVRQDGLPVRGLEARALHRLRDEGAPLRGLRLDMARAAWWPDEPASVFLEDHTARREPAAAAAGTTEDLGRVG